MLQILTSSRARSFAETAWGRGGTDGYRTNRKGAYYFSCSGHGGYIVDGAALTTDELANITGYRAPEKVFVVTNETTGYIKVQNPFSIRGTKYRIHPDNVIDKKYPIFFFEEDCDWAILEKFTNIRAEGMKGSEKDRNDLIDKTFDRWAKPIS